MNLGGRLLSSPLLIASLLASLVSPTQNSPSSAKHPPNPPPPNVLGPGSLSNNLYRNKALGLSYKMPEGWVLRTDELNAREEEPQPAPQHPAASSQRSTVLLAAFSRPPEAKGEDINSSILIAAEPVSSYPGLKEAIQYLALIAEVAKAQGFTQDEDPYEIAIGPKKLVRADFHKDVGTRVMRQSTLAMLSHDYGVSITVIAGTEDDVEELIDALSFTGTR